MFRKLLFWCHLTVGVTAGAVILLMCVSGVLLMYERQLIAWADRGFRSSPQSDATLRLTPEALFAIVQNAEKNLPTTITMQSDRTAPVEMLLSGGRILYTNAYSGARLGEGSRGIRTFFRSVTDWHRWLGRQGSQRPFGRAVTGACNLAFMFMVASGMYLWLPRRWSWQNTRQVLFFRSGIGGKARDFNWHNVIGIWCAIPLFFIVLGGLVISYPWATNLLYQLTGSEPPPTTSAPGNNARQPAAHAINVAGLNQAWSVAEQSIPGWQTITARIPTVQQAPFELTVTESHRGRPDKRHTLTVERATGAIIKAENFSTYNTGRQLRLWLRFVHTGEVLGVAGQTAAGVASAGGAVLVWTGLSLAWRRFRAWRMRTTNADAARHTPLTPTT
jgi:uncharacterized iron-regulated membrane protein